MRNSVIELIFTVVKDKNAFDKIENEFANIAKQKLAENIIECGILPEAFNHDSSEEKLWAKYSDIILAKALTFLDIPSEVLQKRGDSADVLGKAKNYSIVGDAKAFRLTRTAVNQKDLKISSVNEWRKDYNYAVIVMPYLHFPNRSSQIYNTAINHNVTLLSFPHLKFILDNYVNQDLESIWKIGTKLKDKKTPDDAKAIDKKKATIYWEALNEELLKVFDKSKEDLNSYFEEEIKIKNKLLLDEVYPHWHKVYNDYKNLTREAAIDKLLKKDNVFDKLLLAYQEESVRVSIEEKDIIIDEVKQLYDDKINKSKKNKKVKNSTNKPKNKLRPLKINK